MQEYIMRWAYSAAMVLAALLLPAASLFHPKWRRWYRGRIGQVIPSFPPGKPVVWMHVASLGEWEQGRPVLMALRNARPEYSYVVTFFSPSGYERVQDRGEADWVGYLPMDTPGRARAFVRALAPKLVIWVKYDFWYCHWRAIRQFGAPIVLVAAVFREGHFLEKAWGRFIRREVLTSAAIAVQDADSLQRLSGWGYAHAVMAGDTRVDRVLEVADTAWEEPILEAFCGSAKVMIAGSVWPEDMDLLAAAMRAAEWQDWKWLIVPHDPAAFDPGLWLEKYTLFSGACPASIGGNRFLVLDKVGVLKYVYRYASSAYIGGGFGRGLHNTLEPAAYGIPVLFGPRHSKFPEAAGLLAAGGAFEVGEEEHVMAVLGKLSEKLFRQIAGEAAGAYIRRQAGATPKLLPLLTLHLDVNR